MKKISLKELKEDLASYAERAAEGEILEVSKYNKPYIRIVTANTSGVTIGNLVGSGQSMKRAAQIGKITLGAGGIQKLIDDDRDDGGADDRTDDDRDGHDGERNDS